MKSRYLTLAGLLLLTAIFIRIVSYDTYNNPEQGINAIAKIPMQIGQWQGKDIPLEENIYEILETRSIIHRLYSSPSGENVFLSLVYYTETKVDFHAPESCLGGQGVKVTKDEKAVLLNSGGQKIQLAVNQLLRKDDNDNTLVYYFYKAGKFLGNDYIRLLLNLVLNKLLGAKVKSGALIRVSTPVARDQGGEKKAQIELRNFIEELYPFLLQI